MPGPAKKAHSAHSNIKEVVVGATADPPRVILKLHWAGGTHTELIVRKNQTGHHEHVSSGEVIDLIRELSQVCEDGAIVAILNRLGYRTGVATHGTRSVSSMCATPEDFLLVLRLGNDDG